MSILEDAPIKIGYLYVPIDFMILEMEEDTCTPNILRRPFLATARCRNSKLSFDVEDEHVEFNFIKDSKFPSISGECHQIGVVDSLGQGTIFDNVFNDPAEHVGFYH